MLYIFYFIRRISQTAYFLVLFLFVKIIIKLDRYTGLGQLWEPYLQLWSTTWCFAQPRTDGKMKTALPYHSNVAVKDKEMVGKTLHEIRKMIFLKISIDQMLIIVDLQRLTDKISSIT